MFPLNNILDHQDLIFTSFEMHSYDPLELPLLSLIGSVVIEQLLCPNTFFLSRGMFHKLLELFLQRNYRFSSKPSLNLNVFISCVSFEKTEAKIFLLIRTVCFTACLLQLNYLFF